MRWATADCTGDTVQGYRVGWVNANSKAIQAIGTHVITHNDRVSGSKEAADMLAMLDNDNGQQYPEKASTKDLKTYPFRDIHLKAKSPSTLHT